MAPRFVIPPDGAPPLKSLFASVVPAECTLESLSIELDHARAQFACRHPDATAQLVLRHRSMDLPGCTVGEHAAVCFDGATELAPRFHAAAESAAKGAGPEIFREYASSAPAVPADAVGSPRGPTGAREQPPTAWVGVLLLVLGVGLLLFARRWLATWLSRRNAAAQTRALSGLLLVTYVISANGVLNLYPLSTFDMYSDRAAPSVERVLVKRADGSVTQPQRYGAWHCGHRINPLSATPFGVRMNSIPYKTEEVARHISDHWVNDASAREPVSIIGRTYTLRDSGPPKVEDRELLACRVGGFD